MSIVNDAVSSAVVTMKTVPYASPSAIIDAAPSTAINTGISAVASQASAAAIIATNGGDNYNEASSVVINTMSAGVTIYKLNFSSALRYSYLAKLR